MKQLYFVRHGESVFNRAKQWAGSTDMPLTPEGHQQAIRTGKAVKQEGLKFDAIVTSPLERAFVTAKHIAQQIDFPAEKIIVDEKFVERNFGELEGRKDLWKATKYLLDEASIDKYHKVETLQDFQQRVQNSLDYLNKLPYENILLVGHGAFGRALRRAVLDLPLSARGKSFQNAELERLL